jgi:hypothetical protein
MDHSAVGDCRRGWALIQATVINLTYELLGVAMVAVPITEVWSPPLDRLRSQHPPSLLRFARRYAWSPRYTVRSGSRSHRAGNPPPPVRP